MILAKMLYKIYNIELLAIVKLYKTGTIILKIIKTRL